MVLGTAEEIQEKINQVLGIEIPREEVIGIFKRLTCIKTGQIPESILKIRSLYFTNEQPECLVSILICIRYKGYKNTAIWVLCIKENRKGR